MGRDDRGKNSDIKLVKLTGIPMNICVNDLKEWLCFYGTIESDIYAREIKGKDQLKNMDGILDFSNLEVKMKIQQDFRDNAFIEGNQVRITYKNMPRPCFNCKEPGVRCPQEGTAGYACKIKHGETDLSTLYEEEEVKRSEEEKIIKKRLSDAEQYSLKPKSYGEESNINDSSK